jgi:hypothetical protein
VSIFPYMGGIAMGTHARHWRAPEAREPELELAADL